MGQTADGAIKCAAARIGVSLCEYRQRLGAGDKWCTRCKGWHPTAAFGLDRTRFDGLAAQCFQGREALYGERYEPRPRISKLGEFFVATRDGDKLQARARTNHARALERRHRRWRA